MTKIKINFENCYGIKKLETVFDFSKKRTFVIYAPNGAMKTSFAKVFKKIQLGLAKDLDDIRDHIFEREPVIKEIKINNEEIKKEEIFVISSFESFYESKNMASLLINDSLKEKLKEVLDKRNNFLKLLEKDSGLKVEKTSLGKKVTEIENQLLKDFDIKSFLQNLNEFNLNFDYDFSDIKYSEVFDDSIEKKIRTKEFQSDIEGFLSKSDEIYESYKFLEKGKFSLGKLKKISKELKGNNFFVKENKIFLDGLGNEIKSVKELDNEIKKVEDELKDIDEFKKIEKLLNDAKGFVLKTLIENKPEIIVELKEDKLQKFRKKLWLSYFKQFQKEFNELEFSFNQFNSEKNESNFDNTPWKQAYKIFEERFTVPFKMEIDNIKSSVFGESLPKVIFKFWDEEKQKWIKQNREKIESEILSQGEKRALYLLNIIFEIEAIKKKDQKTVFIIDDIADSFDYKNKYAIIEYLNDISKEEIFYQIILTHNFDFFRSVQGRILGNSKMKNCLIASKNKDKIILESIEKKGLINPFQNWKGKVISSGISNEDKNKYLIALIPFVRNIIEYTKGKETLKYKTLTHLLHKKIEKDYEETGIIKKTEDFKFKDLADIYKIILPSIDLSGNNENVLEIIFAIANSLVELSNETLDLENKIVLSIAIRLKTEEFLIAKIDDSDFISNITSNQIIPLINKYKQSFPSELENIKLLEQVNLMTPENIHLNSFMYEPILDLGDQHLKDLYQNIPTS